MLSPLLVLQAMYFSCSEETLLQMEDMEIHWVTFTWRHSGEHAQGFLGLMLQGESIWSKRGEISVPKTRELDSEFVKL